MHRVGAGLPAGVEDMVDDEVGGRSRRRADIDRLVGHFDMQRVAIGVAIDGDGGDAEPARGADDADGNLAAIGDQDLVEHRCGLPAAF